MEKLTRSSGVLLHITSLPNRYTLGTFSVEAINFVDWLVDAGFKVWQVLPINDCGYAYSPYSAKSSYAINPTLIDLTEYLSDEELVTFHFDKSGDLKVEENKILSALDLIYEKYRNDIDISEFEKSNSAWLEDYAMYKVISSQNNNCSWVDFPAELRDRNINAINEFKGKNSREIDKIKFTQFLAYQQWQKIKDYAGSKGVKILGDMPFYIELNSADVWSNPKNWKLGQSGKGEVAGVPPDYFNADGQLWGYPIYNYEVMEKNKYAFFVNRFKAQAKLFDIIRIDHFIAFSRYWAIPKGSKSAVNGKWVKGKGDAILKEIVSKVKVSIIAEDLGIDTDDVTALREKNGIAGLKVMQFAFDGLGDNIYQPHNYEKNCVAYIGTHDNDTFMGLLNHSDWDKINRFKRYIRIPLEWGNDAVVDNVIITLYRSSANLIVLTMQDILKLGSQARMNVPGVIEGNWLWQMDKMPSRDLCGWYKDLASLYGRN